MKVGVNILNFGPGVNPSNLLRWAKTAESLGYHSVLISDHVAITPSVGQRYPEPYFDTFASLAWLAGQTQRVQLGTTVCVLPYRHPILTARLAANIDQLSGGRFIFGVGVGNAEDEFVALGLAHSRRGALADECLRSILALWTQNGRVSFQGRLINFVEVAGIVPYQRPHPPIWVGGASEAALRRVARFGDAWHPILRSLDSVGASLRDIRRQARELGRLEPFFTPRIRFDLREGPVAGERSLGIGSVEQVRADLKELERLGADHVVLDWHARDLEATREHDRGLRALAVLAGEVLDLQNERLR